MIRIAVVMLLGAAGASWIRAAAADRDAEPVVRPGAILQTEPVPHGGDAADDPAIWLHPTQPERSLVIATDKQGGLIVYDMEGRQLQLVSPKSKPDNVDVLYDFPIAGGKMDLAIAGCRAPDSLGLKIWRIDPDTRKLTDITAGNAIPVLGHTEPYGTGVYHSKRSGRFYVLVTNKKGQVEQHELRDAGDGKIAAARVRSLNLRGVLEGCVADDELGWVYVSQEDKGIWKFPAEPDGGDHATLIARVGQHGLKADVEGLTIYCATGGKGYLIASSQGNSTFKVYAREGENAFICTIDPKGNDRIDDVGDTDGIAVTNRPTSATFPKGFLVVQDGSNGKANQNFKLYRWEDIAGDRLLIDTDGGPR